MLPKLVVALMATIIPDSDPEVQGRYVRPRTWNYNGGVYAVVDSDGTVWAVPSLLIETRSDPRSTAVERGVRKLNVAFFAALDAAGFTQDCSLWVPWSGYRRPLEEEPLATAISKFRASLWGQIDHEDMTCKGYVLKGQPAPSRVIDFDFSS